MSSSLLEFSNKFHNTEANWSLDVKNQIVNISVAASAGTTQFWTTHCPLTANFLYIMTAILMLLLTG
jgi:hypothetical protein